MSTDLHQCFTDYNKNKAKEISKGEADDTLSICLSGWPKVDEDIVRSTGAYFSWELSMGLLLPIIFFGGVGIYKYLFPVKEKFE